MKTLFIAALLAILPLSVLAHSTLHSSSPASGAILNAPPRVVSLTFRQGIRLTALSLGDSRLDLPPQSGFGTDFDVPMPPMEKGTQSLEWRGLSKDGHTITGTVDFTVK